MSPRAALEAVPVESSPPTSAPSPAASTLSEAVEEQDLDPRDWQAFRELAHRALDAMLEYQQGVRERPVWQPVPAATEAFFSEPAPREGVGAEVVIHDMLH
ncbi:MAG: hypothetical protein MI919_02740, partial [Holophagales bacterium]|nr:hypothetical protein [Holophagales bacterium]